MIRRAQTFLPIVAVAALLLALLANFRSVDLDVFHEMTFARELFRTGHFPYHDFSSYTATVGPIVHHEWGTGVILYSVASQQGEYGFIVFKYLLVAGIVILAIRAALARGARLAVLCTLAPLAMILGCHGLTTIRAQVFTLLLTAMLLALLAEDRFKSPWWLVAWIPLQLAWINLHAGFVVGIGILGCFFVERYVRTRKLPQDLLLALLLSLALVPFNPYGLTYVRFLTYSLTLDRSLIIEWNSIWSAPPALLGMFIFSLVLPAYALFRLGWRQCEGILLLAVSAVLAAMHVRHGSLYALIWFALVPAWIQRTRLGDQVGALWTRRPAIVVLASLAVTVAALVFAIPRHPFQLEVPARFDQDRPNAAIFPVGPVEYLRVNQFAGNVMTPFNVGAYVSWNLLPDVKVGLDSRYEVAYDPAFVRAIHRMYAADSGWQETLAGTHSDLILVPVRAELAAALAKLPTESSGWKQVYQDDVYLIFAPANSRLPVTDHRGVTLSASFP